jgi:hypothetical protein
LPLPTQPRLDTRPSPKRNTPKRAPLTAPPDTLPAPTAPALHFSSTIFRKASRLKTEEEGPEYISNCPLLFRIQMPMLRRQD